MKVEEVVKLSPIERFVYWIKERNSIYKKRTKHHPKPWTDDDILLDYKFCNVRRIDDRVSKWLMNNWYSPYKDHHNMLQAVGCARMFNLPHTLQAIQGCIFKSGKVMWHDIKETVKNIRDQGYNTFNSAYIVSTSGQKADKIVWVVDKFLTQLDGFKDVDTDSMENTWTAMLNLYGFGTFNTGQVVADLRWAVTGEWADRHTWAPKGPGSNRGLNRVLGLPLNTSRNQEEFNRGFTTLLQKVKPMLAGVDYIIHNSRLTNILEAMDYQNCLCEFDKFCRVLLNEEGRPKCKYNGRS